MVEGGTPNTLLRRGLNRNSLLPGTEIVVDGYQSKDRSKRANGRDVTFTDGRKIFMGLLRHRRPPRRTRPNRALTRGNYCCEGMENDMERVGARWGHPAR